MKPRSLENLDVDILLSLHTYFRRAQSSLELAASRVVVRSLDVTP